MKQLFAALALVLASGGVALADGNGGPQVPNSAFLVWQKQGGEGKPFTALSELNNRQRPSEVAQVPNQVMQR